MFRLLSVLLIIAGLAAVAYGGVRFLGEGPELAPTPAASSEINEVAVAAESQATPTEMDASKPRLDEAPLAKMTVPEIAGFEDTEVDMASTSVPNVLDTLQKVPLAHETPERAKFGRPFDVTLAVDGTGGDNAREALPGRGNIVEGEGFVGVKAQATLSGAAFDIEATTPEAQTVSPLTQNVWRWRVTPRETGSQQLTLELFALDGNEALPVRTFRDEIVVEVSRFGQAVATAQSISPIIMVIGGIGSLLAGLFGAARFFRGH
ncbi:hypothetical protein RYZ27_07375 [Hyphomonas sp. FCG-A18]|uniref:hypothetical protein n=1 Tax=Hyphomonas sp. FCG-A18 TaxID=3080019 RepID=UPI002B2DF63A|nr:hypothetical protein RYZ27_07375 [Hyphomonas sp. FCG-A18]